MGRGSFGRLSELPCCISDSVLASQTLSKKQRRKRFITERTISAPITHFSWNVKATRRSTEKREAVLHFPVNQGMSKHAHFQDRLASHYSLLWNHWLGCIQPSVALHAKNVYKAIILPPRNFFGNNLGGKWLCRFWDENTRSEAGKVSCNGVTIICHTTQVIP